MSTKKYCSYFIIKLRTEYNLFWNWLIISLRAFHILRGSFIDCFNNLKASEVGIAFFGFFFDANRKQLFCLFGFSKTNASRQMPLQAAPSPPTTTKRALEFTRLICQNTHIDFNQALIKKIYVLARQ